MLVGTLVNTHLDYANSLYVGLPDIDLAKLQRTQNMAVRLATGLKYGSHVTEPRKALHWLSVGERITFKILCLNFKAVHGLGPSYFQHKIMSYTPGRTLRSGSANLLALPRFRLKSRGDRRFSAQGPKLWNHLPYNIRACAQYLPFRKLVKTHLFS